MGAEHILAGGSSIVIALALAVAALAFAPQLHGQGAGYEVVSGTYAANNNGYQDYRLWLPLNAPPEGAPLIVFNDGGGWEEPGPIPDKLPPHLLQWVERGYAFAFCRYTWTSPQFINGGRYPLPEQDANAAILHFHDQGADIGVNPNAIIAMGESAGANNMLHAIAVNDAPAIGFMGRALALSYLPSMVQDQNTPVSAHYWSGAQKLGQIPSALQKSASPTKWLDDYAASVGPPPPMFLISGDKPQEYSTDKPYPEGVITLDHHPWNAEVVFGFVDDGVGLSSYVHVHDTPTSEESLFIQRLRWANQLVGFEQEPAAIPE